MSARSYGDVLTVELTGELDAESEEEVWTYLAPWLADPPGQLVLDARHLSFVDSRGFSVLVRMARALDDPGRFLLSNTPPAVQRAIELMGLDRLMTVE